MPTDIQNSERLLDLSNQLNDSINERKKLLKESNAEEQQYLAVVKQQQKLSQDIAANAEKYLGYQIKSKDLANPPIDNVGKYHNFNVLVCVKNTLFLNTIGLFKVVVVTPVIAGVEAPVMLVHVVPLYR